MAPTTAAISSASRSAERAARAATTARLQAEKSAVLAQRITVPPELSRAIEETRTAAAAAESGLADTRAQLVLAQAHAATLKDQITAQEAELRHTMQMAEHYRKERDNERMARTNAEQALARSKRWTTGIGIAGPILGAIALGLIKWKLAAS